MWEWDIRVRWLIGIVLAALFFGAGVQYAHWQHRQFRAGLPQVTAEGTVEGDIVIEDGDKDIDNPQMIIVHVAGAVENPGIYELPAGARVNEALLLAGLLADANPDVLNLAAILNDEQQIIVPRQGEEAEITGALHSIPISSGSSSSGLYTGQQEIKVNINTATQSELETLPGIGPALARRILDYRQQKGSFRSIEDLQNVSGIGAKRFADLKDRVTIK